MASAGTVHNEGTPFLFLKLPTELRDCVYRFLMPFIIRPRKSPLELVVEDQNAQRPSIALSLINKQVNEELSYFLYQYSHFLISINFARVASVALESSILSELDQTECVPIKLASSIKHININLKCVKQGSFITTTSRNLRLNPLLEYVCEHLRAFRCLQTVRVGWKKNGDLTSLPRFDSASFILGPLEQLQADLPRVQMTVRVIQQQSNRETGVNPKDLGAYVKLRDYLSELKENSKHLLTVSELKS